MSTRERRVLAFMFVLFHLQSTATVGLFVLLLSIKSIIHGLYY